MDTNILTAVATALVLAAFFGPAPKQVKKSRPILVIRQRETTKERSGTGLGSIVAETMFFLFAAWLVVSLFT